MTHLDLIHMAAALVEIDQARPGLLDECIGDAWDRIRTEAQDHEHCTPGQTIYIGMMADRVAGLLGVSRDAMQDAVTEAVLTTRRRIVAECVDDYLAMIRGTVEATAPPAVQGDTPHATVGTSEPAAIARARRRAS